MAASNYVPVAGNINVISGHQDNVRKFPIATTPRQFPVGCPMWLSTVAGNVGNVEPCLMPPGLAVNTASNYTSLAAAHIALGVVFAGFTLESRVARQFQDTSNKFSAAGPAPTSSSWADASKPFISVCDEGVAEAPIRQGSGNTVTTAIEVGTMVSMHGIVNEATSGIYCPDGTLQADTFWYLYMNQVVATTVTASAIGVVCEQAPVGATKVKFKFNARYINKPQLV